MENGKYSILEPIIDDLRNKKENETIDKIVEDGIEQLRKKHEKWKENLEDEIPTKKTTVLKFDEPKKIEDCEPVTVCIFKCKQDYEEFYPIGIHGAILKAENKFTWFAVPVKEPYLGTIEWNKSVWTLVYTFNMTIDLFR